jgi:hypothetical protein
MKTHKEKKSLNYELILSRDEYACRMCGSKKNIAVYYKDEDGPATPDNQETLCVPCMCQKKGLTLKVHDPTPRIILELRDNGFSDTKIAKNFLGCTRQRIYQIMEDYTKAMRLLKI